MMTKPWAPGCILAADMTAHMGDDHLLRPPGAHGGDGPAVARALGVAPDQLLDLSASLNPFADDVGAIAGRLASASGLGSYPDPASATDLLAEAIGVDPHRLVLTNGGSEAIALVATVLQDGFVVEPDFSLYRRHLRTGDDVAGGRWRSNPASPLGTVAADGDTAAVWDEAFWPMTMGSWTRGDDTAWRLGSLTKLWACPGVRLGYAIAPDDAGADRIRAAQPRWSVNALGLALVTELLPATDLEATAARIATHRATFAAAVAALGFDVLPGIAPWLLLGSTPGLRAALAPLGVVVRDCASFGLVDAHRIALPRLADVDRTLGALGVATRR